MLIYGGSSNGEHQNRTWRFEFGRNLLLDSFIVVVYSTGLGNAF